MINKNYAKAFEILLKKSVALDENMQIALIYDEYFSDYFDSFSHVVNNLLLKVTYIFIPDSYQKLLQGNKKFYHNEEVQLPLGTSIAVNKSDIVLNFLTGSSKSSKVRGAVLNCIKDNGCKVIHCPNISKEVLDIVLHSSFEKIHDECEMMAWALGSSESATIVTTDDSNEAYTLNIKLTGWQNEPFISSGVICENSWGNIPPGEAFCCPKPANVNGTICINGSVHGYIFEPGEYLYLTFVKGKIVEWKAKPGSEVATYMNRLKTESEARGDDNWQMFAELGIGMNPAIKSLTGNSLFDEKMGGTLHIAIGNNTIFGHGIQSHIHEDLVVLNPTLFLDDKKIINKGKTDVGKVRRWRKSFTPSKVDIRDTDIITFKSAKIEIESETIKRKLNKGNRIGLVHVFNELNRDFLNLTQDFLTGKNVEELTYIELIKKTRKSISSEELINIIELLSHYKMITIKSKNEN